MLFIDLTYRNDWDSSLSNTPSYSYDYQSAGINAVLSSIFQLPETISFWKIRGSYATVGLGLSPNDTYNSTNGLRPYSYSVDAGTIIYPEASLIERNDFFGY